MGILIVIVVVGLLYVLFMLPARRRRQEHAAMQNSVDVGDEIITAGGLHGHVRGLDDEENTVQLEIADGVVVTLDRRAVAAVAREIEVEAEPEPAAVEDESAPETGDQPS